MSNIITKIDMELLSCLIEELESIKGKNRQVDLRIYELITGEPWDNIGWKKGVVRRRNLSWWRRLNGGKFEDYNYCGFYTESISEAEKLLPQGWFWHLENEPMYGGFCKMTNVPDVGEEMLTVVSYASSPALAMSAACLKAWELILS